MIKILLLFFKFKKRALKNAKIIHWEKIHRLYNAKISLYIRKKRKKVFSDKIHILLEFSQLEYLFGYKKLLMILLMLDNQIITLKLEE